jgi:hypothetical protein
VKLMAIIEGEGWLSGLENGVKGKEEKKAIWP